MTDLWQDLLACLELRETEQGACFEGSNQQLTYHRLFGGHLLAQFVRAASLACPDKDLKSLHALFPRAGRSDEPVRYEVERLHERKDGYVLLSYLRAHRRRVWERVEKSYRERAS